MSKIYAVAGNPIFQSRSPRMFNAAFRELALDAVYTRLAASAAEEVITTAREVGIDGLNITSPFKADIIPYLDEVEADARKLGSVNTVVQRAGQVCRMHYGPCRGSGSTKGEFFRTGRKKNGCARRRGCRQGSCSRPSFLGC